MTVVDVQHLYHPEHIPAFERAFRPAIYPYSMARADHLVANLRVHARDRARALRRRAGEGHGHPARLRAARRVGGRADRPGRRAVPLLPGRDVRPQEPRDAHPDVRGAPAWRRRHGEARIHRDADGCVEGARPARARPRRRGGRDRTSGSSPTPRSGASTRGRRRCCSRPGTRGSASPSSRRRSSSARRSSPRGCRCSTRSGSRGAADRLRGPRGVARGAAAARPDGARPPARDVGGVRAEDARGAARVPGHPWVVSAARSAKDSSDPPDKGAREDSEPGEPGPREGRAESPRTLSHACEP